MARVRFRLSTLLILLTFFAISVGLGTQIYLLKQEVARLNGDVGRLKQSAAMTTRIVYPSPNQRNRNTPFRLLNSEMIVNPAIEDGMKAGEWELKQRIEEHRNRDEIRSPKTPDKRLEGILRPLSKRSAN